MKKKILDSNKIKHAILRIAFQIYESNINEKDIYLVGISSNGKEFSKLIEVQLKKISPISTHLIELEIDKKNPRNPVKISTDLDKLNLNKTKRSFLEKKIRQNMKDSFKNANR